MQAQHEQRADDAALAPARGPQRLGRFGRRIAEPSIPFAIVLPDGERVHLGNAAPRFQLTLNNRRALRALCTADEGRFADAYVAGDLDIEGDMMAPFALRRSLRDVHPLVTVWRFLEPRLFGQTRTNRRVIAAHYDLDPEFFLSFLDPQVPSYTQGLFVDSADTLAAATTRKFEYCFEKCRLKAGDQILEIGPGWGAWLEYASRRGVRCTGLSNSRVSIDYLARRARVLGADWDLVLGDVLDYRDERRYDAIVMMGVIEHLPQYARVLAQFQSLVKPEGYVFVDGSAGTRKYELSTFMVKYIFPGNHSFWALHDFMDQLARSPLELIEVCNDRINYSRTFRMWALNLEKNRDFVIKRFSEFDYRRFRLYLWAAACEFEIRSLDCYRMVLQAPGR
jgi:cyclopropane-fatty-acyl-phospholipid synthase